MPPGRRRRGLPLGQIQKSNLGKATQESNVPVKILHTIYDDIGNPWCGGGGAFRTFEIARRLTERHEITLLTGAYPGAPSEEIRDGVRIRRTGVGRSYAASRLSFSAMASRMLARETFDLWVYGFSAFSPLLASASLRRRCVLEFFHKMADHAVKKHPLIGLPARLAEELTLRSYGHIVAISPTVARQIARVRGGSGLHLVYTGIDPACFDAPVSDGDYILYFGRLDIYTKGIDILLKAFAGIRAADPHVRLIVAGRATPKRQREVAAMCAALGIEDRVELTGPVSDERKAALFGGALFTCMPSRYEGWGITAIEAGAAGRAVIGTRIPGLADAICHEKTGLLVPPEDDVALAGAMRRLLEEPETRRRFGNAGRRRARRFTWDRVAGDQERVYEQVVKRQTANGPSSP